ncbi:MAG: hypothetical protein JXA60_06125 [Candidatus Coatesbacteria bacterium]|nr:hypothetical protein [Candidatus Coatesbacteria bacterium]
MKKIGFLLSVLLCLMITSNCGNDPFTQLAKCKFRIKETNEHRIVGIDPSDYTSWTESDLVKILDAYNNKSMPSSCKFSIGIVNPNDGTNGTTKTTATMIKMDWKLYIDKSETEEYDTTFLASGAMNNTFEIPGTGQEVELALDINYDLYTLAEAIGIEKFYNLVLAVAGVDRNMRTDDHLGKFLLQAKPIIETPFGDITYPGWINIHLDFTDGS